MDRQRAVWGAAVAATGAAGLGFWLTATAAALLGAARSPVPLSPGDAMTLLAACLGLILLLWLALGVLATVLALLPGRAGAVARRVADGVAPAVSRRLAAVIVGASLGGALAPGTALARDGRIVPSADVVIAASPSFAPEAADAPEAPAAAAAAAAAAGPGWAPAAEPSPDRVTTPDGVAARSATPAPGWVPDRPLVRRQPSPRLVATSPPREERPGVVVRRGDTLWAIARQHLGPGATDAEVAQEWPRWHHANRAVIGPDPDRLLPGMVLQAPVRAGVRR